MSTSPVVRAALLGAALLGCAACTGGNGADQESAGPSGSGTSSSVSSASSAPSTSGGTTSAETPPESAASSEVAAEPTIRVTPAGPEEERPPAPEPPSDWEETEKRVQAMAAGIEPGVTDEGRATRGVVGAMSGAAAYSDQAPQGADGVVVTCGGKGTGRLITGTGHSVVFHCGAIVDTPLASTDRTLTIELEDDTYWTLAYYEGAPPTK